MCAVLVTGASGNVGAGVVRGLLARGACVKSAYRPGRSRVPAQDTVSVEFDFDRPETFECALEGVDGVFLMRPPHMSEPRAFRPFVRAMRGGGVKRVVFLSVQGAGSNVFVPHNGIERLLRQSGLDWTFLRPSFFMQNLSTTHAADIRDRSEICVPAGLGRTNFIDAADVAEAAAVCLTTPAHSGAAYEITGDEALTYAEVAHMLSEVLGRTITYTRPTASEFKQHMRARGFDDDFVAVMSRIYALARYGLAARTTDSFARLMGRSPRRFTVWAAANAPAWNLPE